MNQKSNQLNYLVHLHVGVSTNTVAVTVYRLFLRIFKPASCINKVTEFNDFASHCPFDTVLKNLLLFSSLFYPHQGFIVLGSDLLFDQKLSLKIIAVANKAFYFEDRKLRIWTKPERIFEYCRFYRTAIP